VYRPYHSPWGDYCVAMSRPPRPCKLVALRMSPCVSEFCLLFPSSSCPSPPPLEPTCYASCSSLLRVMATASKSIATLFCFAALLPVALALNDIYTNGDSGNVTAVFLDSSAAFAVCYYPTSVSFLLPSRRQIYLSINLDRVSTLS